MDIVVTADSAVLDHAGVWLNLAALALAAEPPWLLDLKRGSGESSDG